MKSWEPYLEAN